MPHQRGDLSHPGEPDVDSSIILDFSATATTDQGRVRSVDHPYSGTDGCDSTPG
jgi:hypothetical protein